MTLLPLLSATLTLATGPSTPASGDARPTPAEISAQVDVVEKLNEPVPEQLTFTDWKGRTVAVRDLLHHDKPVLVSLVYYRCPSLCQLLQSGLVTGLGGTGLKLGRDYDLVTLSIDPNETGEMATERRRGHMQALGVPDATEHWTFLTGTEANIRTLADGLGFQYAYDQDLGQFAHAATVFVLTPEGRISRYLYGMRFPSRDLKLALVEAAGGRVGTAFDRFLLTCYQYDAASKRYAFIVKSVIQGGGFLVFVALGALLVTLWRRELKRGTA
ncbi:MAG: SCO family protein [Myxococcaceae bacterium]